MVGPREVPQFDLRGGRSSVSQTRDNSGALFKNTRKKKETHPDFTGECTINGREYYVSGWARTSKDGSTRYTSLAFKPKEAQAPYQRPRSSYPPSPREPGSDDDQGDLPC